LRGGWKQGGAPSIRVKHPKGCEETTKRKQSQETHVRPFKWN
jgi:hypothetical protein